jgi:hypothetical protein
VLAVPTGIVSAEMVRYGRDAAPELTGGHGLLAEALHAAPDTRRCTDCNADQHTADARFCRCCGSALG